MDDRSKVKEEEREEDLCPEDLCIEELMSGIEKELSALGEGHQLKRQGNAFTLALNGKPHLLAQQTDTGWQACRQAIDGRRWSHRVLACGPHGRELLRRAEENMREEAAQLDLTRLIFSCKGERAYVYQIPVRVNGQRKYLLVSNDEKNAQLCRGQAELIKQSSEEKQIPVVEELLSRMRLLLAEADQDQW